MRLHLSAVAAFALASALMSTTPVLAADYPVLRGTASPSLPPAPHIQEDASPWEGFYFGGLAGYNSVSFDPGRSGQRQLRTSTLFLNTYYEAQGASTNLILPEYSSRGVGFGGFLGYNMQFGEAVLGFEADYMRVNRSGGSSGPVVGRRYDDPGVTEQANVTLTGRSEAKLNDLVTMRLRAGYAMGNIMPYLTGGLALGFGEVRTATDAGVTLQTIITDSPRTLGPPVTAVGSPSSIDNRRKNAFMMGISGGAGVEVLLGGLIVRGEYLFSRLQAQGGVIVDVNQARVGAGIKF
jgi:outer membrane immunogenic protein